MSNCRILKKCCLSYGKPAVIDKKALIVNTYYHVSTEFFSRPDPAFAKVGDGNSSQGLGFYISKSLDAINKYLNINKGQAAEGKIQYAITLIPEANIIDASSAVADELLEKAFTLATSSDMPKLAEALRSGASEFSNHGHGSGKMRFYNLEAIVAQYFLAHYERPGIPEDQRKVNVFLRALGIDGTSNQQDIRVINYEVIQTFAVDAIIGSGPKNLPTHIAVGQELSNNRNIHSCDLNRWQAKNACAHDYVLKGKLCSEPLSEGWHALQRLEAEMGKQGSLTNKLMPILDELHLDPKINDGYAARSLLGYAISKAIMATTPEEFDDITKGVTKNLGDTLSKRDTYYLENFFKLDLKPCVLCAPSSKPAPIASIKSYSCKS